MAQLDPELDVLLATKARLDADPSAGTFPKPADKLYFISVKFTGDIAALEQAGLTVGSSVGNIAYGSTDIVGLEALSKLPQVEMIRKMRKKRVQLDESVPDIKANEVWTRDGDNFTGYNGRGVIVGIIDTGIDITHNTFRKADEDGTTRILKIWDQTLTARPGETVPGQISHPTISPTPTPLGYGVEYSRAQIDATLTSSSPPPVAVRHVDEDGHGTNVAGIAAGDGSESGNCHGSYHYIGVATDADILVVRMWGLTEGDSNPPSSSSFMMDAIRWIFNEANNVSQPVAINCSFGIFTESKDGTSTDCLAIDQLLTSNSTGRAIVFAAGNDGDSRFHAQELVPAGPTDTLTLKFRIFPDDTDSRSLVIVYSGSNLELKLQSPVGGANGLINFVTFGNSGNSTTANGTGAGSSVDISNTQADRISITITPPTGGNNMAGVWTLDLRDSSSSSALTSFDAYCLFGSSHDRKSPHFENHDITRSTILEEASGIESIAVGAYQVGGRLAVFSARGPTTDLRVKPEICAPGINITSAALPQARTDDTCEECCCDCCQDAYADMSGTSQAAPHVTGLIALMLHKNPNLTHTDIRNLIASNPTPTPGDSTPEEDFGWGVGKANAKAVLDQVTQVNPPVTLSAVELPGTNQFESLRQRFLETIRGPVLAELFPRHAKEVMALVNSNKKVATVWHRCRGPVWIRLALRAAYTPGMPLPVEVDGISFLEALRRFGEVIKKYASPSFLEDILRYEPELALFEEGMTLEKVIDVFGNRTESAAGFSMQSVWDREPVPSERTS